MTITWGECGHALHPVAGCRVCALAETYEERDARLTRTKPRPAQMVKVTSVRGGRKVNSIVVAEHGAQIDVPMADMSNFVAGQAIEVFDNSDARYHERERWRGREAEANACPEAQVLRVGDLDRVRVPPLAHRANAGDLDGDEVGVALMLSEGSMRLNEGDLRAHFVEVPWIAFDILATPHEVEETIARICPAGSRGAFFAGSHLFGRPIPESIAAVLRDHYPQRFTSDEALLERLDRAGAIPNVIREDVERWANRLGFGDLDRVTR